MSNLTPQRKLTALFGILILIFASCAPAKSFTQETWSAVQLLSTGEHSDSTDEPVEVRNCGFAEDKSTSCSAGTTNDLTMTLGINMGPNVFSFNPEVSAGLGIGRDSGESMKLETPPEGYVYRYTVVKEYRVVTGDVQLRSSSGKEETSSYTFHASCTIHVASKDVLSCSDLYGPSATPDTISYDSTPTVGESPPSTDSVVSGKITFDSKPVQGADVFLSSGAAGCNVPVDSTRTKTDSDGHYQIPIPASARGSQYRIGAVFDNDNYCFKNPVTVGDPSTYRYDAALAKANLTVVSPKYDSDQTAVPTISWNAYPDATDYYVRIYVEPNTDNDKIFEKSVGNVTTYLPAVTLNLNTYYYAYVYAYNTSGEWISWGYTKFHFVH